MSEETPVEESAPPARSRRRFVRRPRGALGWFVLALSVLVLLVAAVGVVLRYGVLTPPGIVLIEASTNGLKLGRVGRLKIEGLSGDIWRNFRIRRLTVADEKGVWLEARDVALAWRPTELIGRRFHATAISANQVLVTRRPTLTPKGVSKSAPLSVDIDSLKARITTDPAFSSRRGDFTIDAAYEGGRGGGARGRVRIASLLHAGDGLDADFDIGKSDRTRADVRAVEAQGGALAGALGLAADQPFSLSAHVDGGPKRGVFRIDSRSGRVAPLTGQGDWTDAGGQARAQVLLAASSLMEGNVRRFGPSLTLAVDARRSGQDLYQTVLDVRSENLTLAAKGPVNVQRRTSSGLSLDARVVDLNRLTSFPKLGGGRFVGVLKGGSAEWEAKGEVFGQNVNFAGYTLASGRGPAEVRRHKGDLDISADIHGAGGSGRGILGAWFGPAPRASVTLTRFADRRILVRRLDAAGAGLTVKGQGTRSILGAFAFDGEAQVSDLAAVKKGASGQLVGRWRATKGKTDTPWKFDFDGRGQNFGSSYAELDRLLGGSPRLQGDATYMGGKWSFARLQVDGDKARVGGAGTVEGQTMKFALDWSANGPFRAGPLEVAGDVKGDGALTGTFEQPRADLNAAIQQIDFPQLTITPAQLALTFTRMPNGGHGAIKLTGASAYGDALARADFRFMDDGVDLSGIEARAGGVTAAGALSLRGRSPSKADLTLAAGPGAFLASGQAQARVEIVDSAGGSQANMRLQAANVRFKDNPTLVRSLGLTASGPLTRLPYSVSGDLSLPQAPVRFEGQGIAAESGPAWAVTFNGAGQVARADVRTISPLTVNFGGPETTATGALAVGKGRADFTARQSSEAVALDARVQNVDLSVASEDLAGQISGVLAVSGRGARLTGSMDATLANARSRDGPAELAINGAVSAKLDDARLTLNANASNSRGLRSTVNVTLPTEASAAPLRVAINRTRPMQGRFDLDGELQPVWDLFFGGERSLGGHLTAQGTLAGTLNSPQIVGQANLANGRFEDQATGLKLSAVTVAADLHREGVDVRTFSASDGRGGSVEGMGRVSLERGGSSTFTINANRFLLLDNDMAEAQASGAVTVTRGADGRARLAGRLTIDRADIVADPPTPSGVVAMEVVEKNRPAGRPDAFTPTPSRAPAVSLDVTLSAPRRIFLRGRGLDVEMSLQARVRGTTAKPELEGTARVVRGDYQFASKRFEFDEQGVVYLAATPDRIRLDLTATREDPSLTAVVKIQGTAAKPEITLTSTPVLPNDEVLSQVLFGRSASQLSPVEAAQLASALSGLATGGGLDVIGNLRSFAGLDRLAFAGGDQSGVAVSGGKYITDDVYLELTGGGREGPSAQVEWRVRRTLSIVSRLAGTGDSRLSVRWRRDYGRPQRR